MASLLPLAEQQFCDANGSPLAAGSVATYIPGTTVPKTTWQDAEQTISNTNPVILDAAGRAIIYGSGSYRMVVKDVLGNLVWDRPTSSISGANSTLGFTCVTDFGAVASGTVDDTAAIQAAFDSMTAGGIVLFPPGTYLVTDAINVTSPYISMLSAGATLSTNNATAHVFNITSNYIEISGIEITSSVTKTAGAFLNVNNANYIHFRDFTFTKFYNGIVISGDGGGPGVVHISHGRLMLGVPDTSNAIVINSGVDLALDNLWIVGGPGANLGTGVLVKACGDLSMDHVSTVYAGNGLFINPSVGQVAQFVLATNCLFDSGSGGGIVVEAAGSVQLLKIADSWSATNASGALILATIGLGGVIQQVDAVNSVFSNSGLHGVTIGTTGVTNSTFSNCSFSANQGHGIILAANTLLFKLLGCTIGQSGEFAGNSQWGMVLGSGCQYLTISNNTFIANGAGSLQIDNSELDDPTNIIHHNYGFVTARSGVVLIPAGTNPTLVVGHGLSGAPLSITLGLTVPGFPVYIIQETASTFTLQAQGTLSVPISVYWSASAGPNA